MLGACSIAHAQLGQGFISDVHLECEVIDPEVDETADVMVWQRINQTVLNFAYAQKVNPTTGALTGSAGQIASLVSAYQYAQAGPKFSNGHDGTAHELYVVYSKRPPGVDTDRSMAFLKYDADADGCEITSMEDCFPLGGENGDDHPETRAIVYSTEEEELNSEPARAVYRYRLPQAQGDLNGLCWVDLNEWLDNTGPETCFYEPTVEWGRITEIDAAQYVVTTFESGFFDLMQAALVSVNDPEDVEIITGKTDSGAANDPQPHWEKFNPITVVRPCDQLVHAGRAPIQQQPGAIRHRNLAATN
jgi:hypothetical protein